MSSPLTRDLNTACAFGTCGVTVSLEKVTSYDLGKFGGRNVGTQLRTFFLSHDNLANMPAETVTEELPGCGSFVPRGTLKVNSGMLLAHLKGVEPVKSKLEEADPDHPLLDAYLGLHNRESLITMMKQGKRCRLAINSTGTRTQLVWGEELMAAHRGQKGFVTFKTDSLAIVSALTRVGVPILDIAGTDKDNLFTLPRFGYALPGISGPVIDAFVLAGHLASGELGKKMPDHPCHWVMQACANRLEILKAIQNHQELLMLRNPRSPAFQKKNRSATIMEGAKDNAWQKAEEHLRG
jgi:hypothetical protein